MHAVAFERERVPHGSIGRVIVLREALTVVTHAKRCKVGRRSMTTARDGAAESTGRERPIVGTMGRCTVRATSLLRWRVLLLHALIESVS